MILVHADLFQDHLLLGIEIRLPQTRAQDVREDIDGLRQVFRQHGRIEDSVLLARVGVVARADPVEVEIDILGAAARRSLEHHVFEEVRNAGLGDSLIARAGPDEEAERDRTRGGTRFADDREAVRQGMLMERH